MGRRILDGVVEANEIIDLTRSSKKDYLMFKVDFKKSYDNVNWNFLFYFIRKMEFRVKRILWMKACVLKISFSIFVHGSPTKKFEMEKKVEARRPTFTVSPYQREGN